MVPTSPGGVQLEWHRNLIDLEIEFSSSGEATVYCERIDDGPSWEKSLEEDDAEVRQTLREVAASGS